MQIKNFISFSAGAICSVYLWYMALMLIASAMNRDALADRYIILLSLGVLLLAFVLISVPNQSLMKRGLLLGGVISPILYMIFLSEFQ